METIDETEPLQEQDSNGINSNTLDFQQQQQQPPTLFRCVIYGSSFRATYASLHVVRLKDDGFDNIRDDDIMKQQQHCSIDRIDPDSDDADPILVRLQFTSFVASERSSLRSFCKRFFKQGDLLEVYGGEWGTLKRFGASVDTEWTAPRFIVHLTSMNHAQQVLQVRQKHYWSIQTCQVWHRAYLTTKASRSSKNNSTDDLDDNEAHNSKKTMKAHSNSNSNITTSYDSPSVPPIWTDHPTPSDECANGQQQQEHHGSKSVVAKRAQAKMVVHFLIRMIMHKIQQQQQEGSNDDSKNSHDISTSLDPSHWATASHIRCYSSSSSSSTSTATATINNDLHLYQAALQQLQRHDGVLDVAGGSGFVSMACGLAGIPSTVIDPRPNVGCLSKRERKAWKEAIRVRSTSSSSSSSSCHILQKEEQTDCLERNDNNKMTSVKLSNASMVAMSSTVGDGSDDEKLLYYCQPVAEFQAKRAWFGQPPVNVDASVRHPDLNELPVVCGDDDNCSKNNRPKQQNSAIVALHPDEATDAIVDYAVAHQIPFLIVPCCVFWRFFPHRRKCRNNVNEPVSTYDDLLEYLMSKHPSIQRTTLPFEGKNQILWSTF